MTTPKSRSQQQFSPKGTEGSANDWSEEFPKTTQEVEANNAETRKVHGEEQTTPEQGPTKAQDTADKSQRNPDTPLKSPTTFSHS